MEERHDIPPRYAVVAKRAAGIMAAADDVMGDWPLSNSQAQAIAALIDLEVREYFREPYTVADGAIGPLNDAQAA